MLNRLEHEGPGGTMVRTYNAQHFPLCDVWAKDVDAHLKLAFDWADRPFTMTKGGMAAARQTLYAFEACSTRRQAAENFDAIYTWIEDSLRAMVHF